MRDTWRNYLSEKRVRMLILRLPLIMYHKPETYEPNMLIKLHTRYAAMLGIFTANRLVNLINARFQSSLFRIQLESASSINDDVLIAKEIRSVANEPNITLKYSCTRIHSKALLKTAPREWLAKRKVSHYNSTTDCCATNEKRAFSK